MERLLKYCLSIILFLLLLFSCDKKLSVEEKKIKSDEMINSGHFVLSPTMQGSSEMMTYTEKAIALDSTNADAWRELSIPYLKRGIPHKWKPLFDKAVTLDSIHWQPWRGYLYLWFYRDYKKAIQDFNASDTLTPNFIDAPQGHSVDYWRGISYLGLKDYDNSIAYFDKYINTEIEESGEDWVEVTAFLYRGIAYFETEKYEKALINFNKQLQYSRNRSADAKYYKAQIFKIQNKIDAAKVLIDEAINDYEIGYYNNRPYVETLRQIYPEDLQALKEHL